MTNLIKEVLQSIKKHSALTNDSTGYNLAVAAEIQLEQFLNVKGYVDVVFDGPPGPLSGRFVEVHDRNDKAVAFGEWIIKKDGDLWALRIPLVGWRAEDHAELESLRKANADLVTRLQLLEADKKMAFFEKEAMTQGNEFLRMNQADEKLGGE